MKKIVAIAAVVAACGFVRAQEEQPQAPKPGKEQELLKQFVGDWEVATKFVIDPKAKPDEGKGTETGTLTCGGMWLVYDFKGTMMGGDFIGHGTLGWDSTKNKFVVAWVDNFSVRISLGEGSFDKDGKVLTMLSEETTPDKKLTFKMKHVTTFKDKDTKTTVFSTEQDGTWVEMGWMEYKRKK